MDLGEPQVFGRGIIDGSSFSAGAAENQSNNIKDQNFCTFSKIGKILEKYLLAYISLPHTTPGMRKALSSAKPYIH